MSGDPHSDPDYVAESDRLRAALSAGQITMYDYNAGRKRALDGARERVAQQAAAPPAPTLEAPAAAEPDTAAPASPPTSGAWAAQAPSNGWGERLSPKRWSADGRGDDPTVRVVLQPTQPGIGDGKVFLFLFGLKKAREIDQEMLRRERAEIDDDIEVLRNAGYTVVVDPEATREDFLQTIYAEGELVAGLIPAGIYWSAHGHDDGAIETCDGGKVRPVDVETARVSPGLKLVVFGACYTGAFARTWRDALGGRPLVVGWGRPVTIDRAVSFLQTNTETDTDFDDLIARYILTDAPVPDLPSGTTGAAASLAGNKPPLAERIATLGELLGAPWREAESWYELDIPMPDRRHHVVRVFTVQSAEAFSEGKELVGAEAITGELSGVVDTEALLRATARPSYARVALVSGPNDLPVIVTQGFMPFGRMTNTEVAALAYQVAAAADRLEREIFGYDAPA